MRRSSGGRSFLLALESLEGIVADAGVVVKAAVLWIRDAGGEIVAGEGVASRVRVVAAWSHPVCLAVAVEDSADARSAGAVVAAGIGVTRVQRRLASRPWKSEQ